MVFRSTETRDDRASLKPSCCRLRSHLPLSRDRPAAVFLHSKEATSSGFPAQRFTGATRRALRSHVAGLMGMSTNQHRPGSVHGSPQAGRRPKLSRACPPVCTPVTWRGHRPPVLAPSPVHGAHQPLPGVGPSCLGKRHLPGLPPGAVASNPGEE